MSTKIWRAYRLKKSRDLWPFVAETKRLGVERVKADLMAYFLDFMGDVDQNHPLYKKAFEDAQGRDALARATVVNKIFTRGYRISNGTNLRSLFDFNVSITFREYKKRVYLIPYCDGPLRKTLDFLNEDPRLEDYHYQNQTDKPDHISMAAWRGRGKVWGKMLGEKMWSSYLTLEVCNWDMYFNVNPFFDEAFMKSLYRKQTGTVSETIRTLNSKE